MLGFNVVMVCEVLINFDIVLFFRDLIVNEEFSVIFNER